MDINMFQECSFSLEFAPWMALTTQQGTSDISGSSAVDCFGMHFLHLRDQLPTLSELGET